MHTTDAEKYRDKAKAARERGNDQRADQYEKYADDLDRLAEMSARAIRTTLKVKGKTYRVGMNYNDDGEWYAKCPRSRRRDARSLRERVRHAG